MLTSSFSSFLPPFPRVESWNGETKIPRRVHDALTVLSLMGHPPVSLAGLGESYDEKNIRRRVYDALNVLEAVEMIAKDKRQIEWVGWHKVMRWRRGPGSVGWVGLAQGEVAPHLSCRRQGGSHCHARGVHMRYV